MEQSDHIDVFDFPIFRHIYRERAKFKRISLACCYICAEYIKQNVQKYIISKKPWNTPRLLFLPLYRLCISYIIIYKLILISGYGKAKRISYYYRASQGIGAVIAAGLATDGYRVVLIARSKQNLEKVHDEIMRSNKHVQEPIVLPLDITDCTKADTEIKDIHQKYGAVDILVNAAAMFMDGSLSEPVDNFRKIMEINVIAQYGILKTVTEIMKVQKNGYIFNVASRAAKYGFADGGIYGSTKFALLGLAESLYRELAPLGIRVTTLCPGWVNTDMAKKAGTPFKDEEMIQPDDLLNTIRCLLNLSENVCIKDIVFEMKKSII